VDRDATHWVVDAERRQRGATGWHRDKIRGVDILGPFTWLVDGDLVNLHCFEGDGAALVDHCVDRIDAVLGMVRLVVTREAAPDPLMPEMDGRRQRRAGHRA